MRRARFSCVQKTAFIDALALVGGGDVSQTANLFRPKKQSRHVWGAGLVERRAHGERGGESWMATYTERGVVLEVDIGGVAAGAFQTFSESW